MKLTFRTLLFLLCGVMLASAVACTGGNEDVTTGADTTEPVEDATEQTAEQVTTEEVTTEEVTTEEPDIMI